MDFFYAFQCFVFVVELCTGARCGRVIQTVGWCRSFFGKAWGLFWKETWGGGLVRKWGFGKVGGGGWSEFGDFLTRVFAGAVCGKIWVFW